MQLVLGNPLKELNIRGAEIITRESELNITVSVDQDQISITEFMAELSKVCTFTDISIKEMPMETIITHIYQSKK